MSDQVTSKQGEPINEGDHVETKIRGGKREGDADKIVTTEKEAEQHDVKNPPKVVFTDQHGHDVAHNPGTLSKT
ncbi:hypothetical protein NA57DRAFT_74193 [Rhizodiscina lignyota]|uniref:Hypervirulence associated protein TUDOR domain-containing protein n=1 Tax=Rhizodiscina lignyota TaxID=1504668 RepID=A0A9P4IM11_9PEZI|nr:hypothetical protein NA57DRAFT_74193 [Rhizodiscina lignyota]